MRASDADREQAVAALRQHLAAGRLSIDEFGERLDQTYAARTLGDLADLQADLPGADFGNPPGAWLERSAGNPPVPWGSRRPVDARRGRFSPAWRRAWGSWLAVSLFVFAIWLASGASGGLWFLWVVLPLGGLLLGRWIMGTPASSDSRSAHPRHDHGPGHGDQARR
jgi:hypothetical protein